MPDLSFLTPASDVQYLILGLVLAYGLGIFLKRKSKLPVETALSDETDALKPATHTCQKEEALDRLSEDVSKIKENQERIMESHSSIQASLSNMNSRLTAQDARLSSQEHGLDRIADLLNTVILKLAERKL